MAAIIDNKAALAAFLPTLPSTKMHNERLVHHLVTPDVEDRLAEGRTALEERIDAAVSKAAATTVPAAIDVADTASLLVSPETAGGEATSEKKGDNAVLTAKHQLLWAHFDASKHVAPPVLTDAGR